MPGLRNIKIKMSLRSAPSVILSAAKNLREAISDVARQEGKIHWFTEILRSADSAQDDNNQGAGLARPARTLLAPATAF
jgi:hypothetical protein